MWKAEQYSGVKLMIGDKQGQKAQCFVICDVEDEDTKEMLNELEQETGAYVAFSKPIEDGKFFLKKKICFIFRKKCWPFG